MSVGILRHGMPLWVALAASVVPGGRAWSQALPDGWTVVADRGDTSGINFTAMPPGWHNSPGPAAIIFQPSRTVDESFRVEMEAHNFVDGRGGFGVFFGTPGRAAADHDFFEVLLDGQGRFRLGHWAGLEYHEIAGWTRHEAIRTPTAELPAENRLRVDVSSQRFAVTANGAELISFVPPEYARFGGVLGIRLLENASVHITRLEVEDR
jgi:hypothetical protein